MPEVPIQVTFRNMDRSDAVEARIQEKVDKLERYFGRLISCNVVVEASHRQHHKGNLYDVKIHLAVPGKDLVVNRAGPKNHAHEDVYVAVRDAFDAASRQLEDHARVVRGEVKAHEAPDHGRIIRLFGFQGYGFIQMADGREIYFHKNAVTNGDFEKLEVGNEVRVVVAEGESAAGPQASTVTPIGKHHIVK